LTRGYIHFMRRIKIITRGSNLALQQVKEVLIHFPCMAASIITCNSYGDARKDISLMSGVPSDFFTRELDRMLCDGKGDIAIHSAKDLPIPLPEGCEVIALLKADDTTDSLVSRENLPLRKLPQGAHIGTSSPLRKEQLLKIRPDVTIVPIRGTIEERLALIDQKKIDALVVATCALKRLGLAARITEVLPFETHPLQGALAVVARDNRADLKMLFSAVDIRTTYGKVYLIGAGPGQREFLTIKADEVLQHADVIIYDDLIDTGLLDRYDGRKVYAGKRKGKHSLPQEEINKLLYQEALKRQLVARLKGGDPFIFGRGGEELCYLRERLIDVEVIPGITSALAAAASAQIPLTLRGVSRKVSFQSGHHAKGLSENGEGCIPSIANQVTADIVPARAGTPRIIKEVVGAGLPARGHSLFYDFPELYNRSICSHKYNGQLKLPLRNNDNRDVPSGETIVYFMGASNLPEISRSLQKSGIEGSTPAALVRNAGCADEDVIVTTVHGIGTKKIASPLMVIVGKTAGMYAKRPWILFTGLEPYRCLVPGKIVHYPLIEIQPIEFTVTPEIYGGVIFTSKQAVRAYCRKYRILPGQTVISIGPSTTRELKKYGSAVNYMPDVPDSDGVKELIERLKLKKLFYPCSSLSRNALHDMKNVETVVVYRTVDKKQPRLRLQRFSAIVFSSPSTVKSFFRIYKSIPKSMVVYVYGKHTAATLKGYHVQTVPLS